MATPVTGLQQVSCIHVLLVEDNDIAAEMVRGHLAESLPTAQVERATTLEQAIDHVRRATWDVVLLDLGLPRCEGLEALRGLREHDQQAPIVVITAHDDPVLAAEALEEEAQDYLTKSEVDASTLARAIRYAIGRQQILVRMQHVIEEARSQERNLHELIRRSADGVLIFDASGRVTFVNQASEPMFGKQAGELLGERLSMIDLDRDQAEIEVQTDAGLRVLDVRVVPVDWQGQPSRMAWVRDQTERRRAEELRAQLQRSERLAAIGKLAAGIAHEINNPLTYVMGSLDMMQREFVSLESQGVSVERLRMLCEGANEGTGRVVSIVRDLSVFSRRDADEPSRPTDLREVIESALKMVHPQIQHRARIERDFADTDLVMGQSGRLTQVFVNLLVNAAHAIEEGHVEHNTIRVRTWQEHDRVHACVQDSGCGVPPEALERLFEPFYTTKSAGEGTGLGLYVCRNIVDSYGGEIEVTSEVGRGTQVRIQLPAWAGASRLSSPARSEPPPSDTPGARILVVDDEARIRELLVDMLSPDHQVVTAGSGREGQAVLSHDRGFDVVLCDVVMDDVSGLELQQWMQEHVPELMPRLLFMSGGGIGERSSRVSIDGGERILRKPFRRKDVLHRVHAVLREQRPA